MRKKLPYYLLSINFIIFLLVISAPNNLAGVSTSFLDFTVLDNLFAVKTVSHNRVKSMQSIMFSFRSDVSVQEQAALLNQINDWNGIITSGHLKPDSKNPAILKMCYVYVNDGAETEVLTERLSALPEIESVSIPAARRLL